MTPLGKPGPLTDVERFVFESTGYLVIPGALTPEECDACMQAAIRCHSKHPKGSWRQIGNSFEQEPAFENLIDHPSVLPKARALFGDRFILQSSWCTSVPAHFAGGGWHQDGSSAYEFRKLATLTPLVQLRIGFFLTHQPTPGYGNMEMIPGSHNAATSMPSGSGTPENPIPTAEIICGEPGTALMFHQGVYHRGGPNHQDYDRYIIHMVYAPPWLIRSDRMGNSLEFLERLTPMRRALMGQWTFPEESFHMPPLPFND
ncbi:phytanoyl-CoA dioxygenase family protein [Candidatus Poribacteria bacterium]|nr:phytanoyl-CoA dioxygenase family protein [Candidatus Poribacteria bacterium]